MNMQKKMFKPQMILFALTFVYFFIFPILNGLFQKTVDGVVVPVMVVNIPGFGEQAFFIWYFLCSFFFGTLASRIVGVLQTE
jgi:uncharacterized membrane protein (DUF106 family)